MTSHTSLRALYAAAVVFSSDFKDWAASAIRAHFPNVALDVKLSNAIAALKDSVEFRLTAPAFSKNENGLVVSILSREKAVDLAEKVNLELILWSE